MLLYVANQTAIDFITCFSACTAIIITILFFLISNNRENKARIIDNFDQIYSTTFTLRSKISKKHSETLFNEEFFYELDIILNNESIKEDILDYLTKMENLFFLVIKPNGLDRTFKKLVSYPLYARWITLYGFIIKYRQLNNNPTMFINYITVIERVEKLKKIHRHINKCHKRYYVGIRGSDATRNNSYSELIKSKYFSGIITMFMDNGANYTIRPNQNIDNKEYFPFVKQKVTQLIKSKKDIKFMFYNGNFAFKLPEDVQKNVMCINNDKILTEINDKLNCKKLFIDNGIPIINYQTILGSEILNKTIENVCKNTEKYIIQNNFGGGGLGTFLLTKENFEWIKPYIQPLKQYILSPYLENSISTNVHVFISDKQTVLSPGSIQIIELHNNQLCYRGADFFTFRTIDDACKREIKKLSLKIANILRAKQYRGVAGIDFIISADKKVYCTEINPRFQASSILLNFFLSSKKTKPLSTVNSVYELNEQAFNNIMQSTMCFEDEINYSCYYYYNDGLPISYFKSKSELLKEEGVLIDLDGLTFNNPNSFDENSYMFRAIFPHPICAISPDNQLWINDNIKIVPKPQNIIELKIALLNQGVCIKPNINQIKQGVYKSVDIRFLGEDYNTEPIDINCAYQINLSQYSPFVINNEQKELYYYNEKLGNINVELDSLNFLSDDNKTILYLATDRLRIKMISGCEFKNLGRGCAFCDVPASEENFDLNKIYDALKLLRNKNISFRHILIGGGTCLNETIWDKIKQLAKYLKEDEYFKNKPLSLMCILPPIEQLVELKKAGITEVAFNLEIANENLAKKYMKGKFTEKKRFYEVMTQAIKIFGIGNVRSAIIVGLDKKDDLIKEVQCMAQKGILPCLSALRALPDASLKSFIHPSNNYLYEVYTMCKECVEKETFPINKLGPQCKRCRNNMLNV